MAHERQNKANRANGNRSIRLSTESASKSFSETAVSASKAWQNREKGTRKKVKLQNEPTKLLKTRKSKIKWGINFEELSLRHPMDRITNSAGSIAACISLRHRNAYARG